SAGDGSSTVAGARSILVVSHTGRTESLAAAAQVCRELLDGGVAAVTTREERQDLIKHDPALETIRVLGEDVSIDMLELGIVLGGDGTILRAAELLRGCSAPILGVNLGHVGFLAESERDDLAETVRRALNRDYLVEQRMTLDVRVKVGNAVAY